LGSVRLMHVRSKSTCSTGNDKPTTNGRRDVCLALRTSKSICRVNSRCSSDRCFTDTDTGRRSWLNTLMPVPITLLPAKTQCGRGLYERRFGVSETRRPFILYAVLRPNSSHCSFAAALRIDCTSSSLFLVLV